MKWWINYEAINVGQRKIQKHNYDGKGEKWEEFSLFHLEKPQQAYEL